MPETPRGPVDDAPTEAAEGPLTNEAGQNGRM